MTKNMTSIPRAKSPRAVGVDVDRVKGMLDEFEKVGIENHSYMVLRHGQVAVEGWNKPFAAEIPHTMYSVSKSITSTAAGFAIDEGFFALEDMVASFFPEYPPKAEDKNWEKLTVRHLITMTSGKNINLATDKARIDWIEDFVNASWDHAPGDGWKYVNENIYMLSAILVRTTGVSVTEYLTSRLFEPLDIEIPFWEVDKNGVEAGGWGIYLKTEDLAKIILCYSNGGKAGGKQVIPEEWAHDATSKQVDNNVPGQDLDGQLGYGYAFWRNGGCVESYRMDGMFSQFAIVFEEYDASLVLTCSQIDEQMVRDVIWKYFPACFIEEDEKAPALRPVDAIENLVFEVPAVSKHSRIESKIANRSMTFGEKALLNAIGFPLGVLTLPTTFMTTNKAGNIDNLSLSFDGGECSMTWSEGPETNTVLCGMDGEYRWGDMRLGDIDYKVCAYAMWLSEYKLQVHIRPVETVAKRILTFTFDPKRNTVAVVPSSSPAIEGIILNLGDTIKNLIHNTFVSGLLGEVLKKLGPVIEPTMRGKFTD